MEPEGTACAPVSLGAKTRSRPPSDLTRRRRPRRGRLPARDGRGGGGSIQAAAGAGRVDAKTLPTPTLALVDTRPPTDLSVSTPRPCNPPVPGSGFQSFLLRLNKRHRVRVRNRRVRNKTLLSLT